MLDPCWIIMNAEADCPPHKRRPKTRHPGSDGWHPDWIETVLAGPETGIQIPRVGQVPESLWCGFCVTATLQVLNDLKFNHRPPGQTTCESGRWSFDKVFEHPLQCRCSSVRAKEVPDTHWDLYCKTEMSMMVFVATTDLGCLDGVFGLVMTVNLPHNSNQEGVQHSKFSDFQSFSGKFRIRGAKPNPPGSVIDYAHTTAARSAYGFFCAWGTITAESFLDQHLARRRSRDFQDTQVLGGWCVMDLCWIKIVMQPAWWENSCTKARIFVKIEVSVDQ